MIIRCMIIKTFFFFFKSIITIIIDVIESIAHTLLNITFQWVFFSLLLFNSSNRNPFFKIGNDLILRELLILYQMSNDYRHYKTLIDINENIVRVINISPIHKKYYIDLSIPNKININ